MYGVFFCPVAVVLKFRIQNLFDDFLKNFFNRSNMISPK